MKKFWTISAIACLTASIFALDLSVGGGLDYSLNVGAIKGNIKPLGIESSIKSTQTESYLGVNAFFDVTYLRLSLGADFGVGGKEIKTEGSIAGFTLAPSGSNEDYRETNLNLNVVGKFPFKLGIIDLYPMLGFDFAFNVAAKDGDIDLRENASDKAKSDLNHYYFIAGLGADIKFGKFFITPTATFGVDLKKHSSYEDFKKLANAANGKYRHNNFLVNFGLGFGYKL